MGVLISRKTRACLCSSGSVLWFSTYPPEGLERHGAEGLDVGLLEQEHSLDVLVLDDRAAARLGVGRGPALDPLAAVLDGAVVGRGRQGAPGEP